MSEKYDLSKERENLRMLAVDMIVDHLAVLDIEVPSIMIMDDADLMFYRITIFLDTIRHYISRGKEFENFINMVEGDEVLKSEWQRFQMFLKFVNPDVDPDD